MINHAASKQTSWKRVLSLGLLLIVLTSFLFGLIVLFKPGASFFYKKDFIQTQKLTFAGSAYEYPYKINTRLYNPDSLLVLEDHQMLARNTLEYVSNGGIGHFAIKDIDRQEVTLLFLPTTVSDPATNGHTYSIYIRPDLISSNHGGLILLLSALVLLSFLFFSLADPRKRKILFGSPLGIVRLWFELIEPKSRTKDRIEAKRPGEIRLSMIKQAALNIGLMAFIYVFMEWIFYLTKPSFMDMLSLFEKFDILLITGLAISLLLLLALPVIFLLDILLSSPVRQFIKYAYYFPAVFLAACLCLILIDNFTYTLFGFGIVNSVTLVRVLYGLVFVGLVILMLNKLAAWSNIKGDPKSRRSLVVFVVGLAAIALILTASRFKANYLVHPYQSEIKTEPQQRPNIILLSADGVNAESMSVYGYERDTTPFMRELAKTSLVSLNNFTNAAKSMGSETALLTGKTPFANRVLYPPDTLLGKDMYQHLPGLLKLDGYRTISLGVPYFVDANTIHFQSAFDAVNCRENPADNLSANLSKYGYGNESYFATTILGRIGDRLKHIFFIKDMENPYILVTEVTSYYVSDQERLTCLRSDLYKARSSGQPLFAHIHLIATHGSTFAPFLQVFSSGETQDQPWMTDFYDDAILNFDIQVEQLVQYLKSNGMYENTILILYTDHGQKYTTTDRLPLIIHFPSDQYAGSISENTQSIDIAPTLLDYLGLPQPDWMEGSSLLRTLDPTRLILAGDTNKVEIISGNFLVPDDVRKPPFYQFSQLSAIQCQKWYFINLEQLSLTEGVVADYVNPCKTETLDSPQVIWQKVGKYLKSLGYDVPPEW